MTVRDEFAKAAMQGVLSNNTLLGSVLDIGTVDKIDQSTSIAQFSYGIAEAMLRERSKP